jgi:coenzyme F420-reducing hydrogenase delta subunit
MFNMSAAMAGEFVAAATQITEQITSLGPNPLRAPVNPSTNADRGE